MIDHDPDFWPTLEEAEEISKDNQEFWRQERQRRVELYSVWQDYEDIIFMCDKCSNILIGDEADTYYESDSICALHCPKCHYKLLVLQTEASQEELLDLANKGNKKVIQAINSRKE